MKKLLIFLISAILIPNLILAQCPAGQTEITIEIYPVSFGNEVGWELTDQTTGTVIACQSAGTYATGPGPVVEGPFCVTDGNTIVFTGYDSFSDGWNGGFFNVIITEDGSVNGCAAQDGCLLVANGGEDVDVEPDVSVTNSCETSNEEFVVTLPVFACDATPFMGCTNPTDSNYNPCANIDDGSCICGDLVAGLVDGAIFCATDNSAVSLTAIVSDSPLTAVQTVDGSFDGEHGIGLYAGTFDDGSVIGLPSAGTGLLGTDTETSIESSTPGANNINTAGNWGNPSAVGNSITSAPLMDGATYTVFIVDDFGDGWDGSDVDLVDCEGNVVVANLAQYIDAIANNAQDELAWTTFTYNAPAPTITWSGTGAVTTDLDGTPNSGDETYTFDPEMAGATGCEPVDIDLTMSILSCGLTCEEVLSVTVYPPAQTPMIVRNDITCTYTVMPACPNDVVDPPTIPDAAPGDDPGGMDFTVTTADGCMGAFFLDPEACPPPAVILGCTDPCAPNYDATAEQDDGSCETYDMTCNTDCTAGPFGGTWDAATCSCINETTPVIGCTDPTSPVYNPAADCDNGSCTECTKSADAGSLNGSGN